MNQVQSSQSDSTSVTNQAWRNCINPSVSVVVTLFNYFAYIRGCLDSVRGSKTNGLPGGFEVVVVNDGSTDNSAAVVEEYMASQPLPICLVKKPVNGGLADARNTGLHAARAPLVFILDADNEIRPGCLQAHYRAMVSSGCAMAYGRVNRFDHATRKCVGMMSHSEWNVRDLVAKPCVDAMAMLDKATVLKLGGYSTEYGTLLPQGWEDYDLCLKLAQAGYSARFIPEVLSDYRVHPRSMINETNQFRRELALYFARKFHALAHLHPDTPTLFDFPRRELQISSRLINNYRKPLPSRSQKVVRQVLGTKLSRSICKRLAAIYDWMSP